MASDFLIFHNEQTFFALSFLYDILNAQEHVTMNLMENLKRIICRWLESNTWNF